MRDVLPLRNISLTPLKGNELTELYVQNNALNGNYDALNELSIYGKLYIEGNGYDKDPDALNEYLCTYVYGQLNYWY